jgi:hypothetical protein
MLNVIMMLSIGVLNADCVRFYLDGSTLSITTVSKVDIIVTLSINDTQHNRQCHYTEWRIFIVLLNADVLNVVSLFRVLLYWLYHFKMGPIFRCLDTHHNYSQHNNSQHNGTQHNHKVLLNWMLNFIVLLNTEMLNVIILNVVLLSVGSVRF